MSHHKNHIVTLWEDVEAELRRTRNLRLGREKLSCDSTRIICDCYSLWTLVTRDILDSVGMDFVDYKRWLNNVTACDVHELFSSLKEGDNLLLNNPLISFDDFKHHLKERYPFIGAIIAPIKPIFALWSSKEDHAFFLLIHNWFSFPSRLNFKSRTLEKQAVEAYLLNEDTLPSDGFSLEEREVIEAWYPNTLKLRTFFLEECTCKHGNGSTADAGNWICRKYDSMGVDVGINLLVNDKRDLLLLPRPPRKFSRTSKLQMVPKSALSYRSISMEPATLMWYQQGFLAAWVRDLETRNHKVRRRFHPSFQSPNQELAWEGSIDGSFSTIDLSAASDSVTWKMVKSWFSNTPLYRWMLLTRSASTILPDKRVIPVKKFAPMGSALCFPIESLVFAAIVECAIKEAGGDPDDSRYRVYGDDIIVETEFAQGVIRRLAMNGFKTNVNKTFTSAKEPIFRESCGGEYLDGFDVTPIRISRKFSGLVLDRSRPAQIKALIDLANECYTRFPSVRRRCVHALKTIKPAVLFDEDGSRGVFSTTPTNYHLQTLEISSYRGQPVDYQRLFFAHGCLAVRYEQFDPDQEDIRLFEYLRLTQSRQRLLHPEDGCCVRSALGTTKDWVTAFS